MFFFPVNCFVSDCVVPLYVQDLPTQQKYPHVYISIMFFDIREITINKIPDYLVMQVLFSFPEFPAVSVAFASSLKHFYM